MIILGVHSGHDCGAAIVSDGRVVAAVNEERITRDKLVFGTPYKSIHEVLRLAGLAINDVNVIALESIATPHGFFAHARPWIHKALQTHGRGLADFFMIQDGKLRTVAGLPAAVLNLIACTGLPRFFMTDLTAYLYLRRVFGFSKQIKLVSHHHAHLASAYYTSGFEDALSVVIEEYDGRDAFKIDCVRSGEITPLTSTRYPHSPGVFYALITRMLGYNPLLHAGKVTGLAAYADPAVAQHCVDPLMWDEGMQIKLSPQVYELTLEYARTQKLPRLFSEFTPEQLSAAFQHRLEEVITRIVTRAVEQTGLNNIVLSGGVAANVRLNQCISEISGVKEVVVHPGMSDCGTALGAALWVSNAQSRYSPQRLKHVYLGHDVTSEEAVESINQHGLKYSQPTDRAGTVAELLAEQKIVVRVAGPMEYGPRALGNRSILYHCRDVSINKWLNHRLQRTEFMPFAPMVLAEHASQCFTDLKKVEYTAQFMTVTADCTEWMKEHCPAVVHLDGTARPQLINAEQNPQMYAILSEYYRRTGVPVLINTSYNIHNQPIAMTAEDALIIFKSTALDYLLLGDCLISATENNLLWKER